MLKLGQLLVSRGLLDPDQLSSALAEQQEVPERLGMILIRRGFVDEETLIRTLAGQLKLPVARVRGKRVGPEVVECVPVDLAEKHRCLPLFFKQDAGRRLLFVAMEDPSDAGAIEEISRASGHEVRAVLVGPMELEEAIQRHYHWTAMTGESSEALGEPSVPTPAGGIDAAADELGSLSVAADPDELEPLPVATAPEQPSGGEDLELDFDGDWCADADPAEGELAIEDGSDAAELGLAPGDDGDPLDFDPQFQLDLPEVGAEPETSAVAPPHVRGPEALDPRIILRALSQLLVEKGVITREEFVDRLSEIAVRESSR